MGIIAKWHLKDIITIAIISVLFGFIFVFSDWLYTLVYSILSPLGLGPFVGEGLFGLWCMGGPIAFMVVRLPGSSLISEILGAFLESGLGGQFGVTALFAGFFQGLGSELGFASFKYKRFDIKSLLLAAVFSTVITFGSALFIHGYIKLKLGMMLALFLTRLCSNLIFSVGLVSLINKLVVRAQLFETRKS
ncbi:ABC transporter permease [Lentilactobacillus fungorum]|uniref:ABC transporter permease n=1 Tax=Lentilactobacillus fungorum TaxID=2201250 RepID=A0ABQ3W233_9LACO|nr:ECF transporter S component [Lentilactobacillus fungorum]GHP15243.1 ABC transporter permease [Lentilactobacillus fungorum]